MRVTILALTALAVLVLGLPAAFVAGGPNGSVTAGGAIGSSCTVRSPGSAGSPDGPGGTGTSGAASVGGRSAASPLVLDANQMTHARAIAGVVRKRQLPERVLAIAMTGALAASNLDAGGATLAGFGRRGLFALDPAGHPGVDLQDPVAATNAYLDRLTRVPGHLELSLATAADRTQRAPFDRPHGQWAPAAAALAAGLVGRDASLVRCTVGEVVAAVGTPLGAAAARALAAARAQLGVWYVWAGGSADGPTTGAKIPCTATRADRGCGFDCSGLVLHAWAQAGVALPRTSRQQYNVGRRIPLANARPGDLIFLATDTGNPGSIHHVAMVESRGRTIEAQQTGVPVHTRSYRGADEPEIMPFAVRIGG